MICGVMNKRGGRVLRRGLWRNVALGVAFFFAAFAILAVAYYKPASQSDWGRVPELKAEPVATRPIVKAVFFGDEISAAPAGTRGYTAITAANMNWQLSVNAVGGSGYVSPGGNAAEAGDRSLQTRAADVIATRPSVLVVAAGRYDNGASEQSIKDATHRLYSTLRTGLPKTKIVIITPWVWNTPDDAAKAPAAARTTAAIREAAATIGASVIDQRDLIQVGPDNADAMLTSNKVLSLDGHLAIARGLVRELLHAKLPLGPQDWQGGALTGEWVDEVEDGAESFARGAA